MSELWDAPNQQTVRPDESAPWDEGAGGSEHPGAEPMTEPEALEAPRAETDYEAMTKDELIALAQSRGVSPANAAMTKGELIAALDSG